MLQRQKLSFQLTPLLDLLLIVIFAQYMEVQHTSAKAEQEIARRADEQTAAALQAQRIAEQRLADIENQRQTLLAKLQSQLAEATEEMQRVLDQRKDLAKLVENLFQIPKEALELALSGNKRTPQEQEQLRDEVKRLADDHRKNVIKYLITHQAMRKRVDVWTLFITKDGSAQIKAGDETHEFTVRKVLLPGEAARLAKLPLRERVLAERAAEIEAAEKFAEELFNFYKTLPQPKSIVVMVVSWNRDLKRYYREPVQEGLKVTLQLFHTNNDRTQFIPAVLGAEVE